jgi:hypothetical protein
MIPFTIGTTPVDEWKTVTEKAISLCVATHRNLGETTLDDIRRKIILDARVAIGPKDSDDPKFYLVRIINEGGKTIPMRMVSAAGILRNILDCSPLNRLNEMDRESFMAVIQRRLDAVLADPSLLEST